MLNENTIEQSFIDQLISQGYTYYNGTDISPISDKPQRESFTSVILEQHFKDSLKKLNQPYQNLHELKPKKNKRYFITKINERCAEGLEVWAIKN